MKEEKKSKLESGQAGQQVSDAKQGGAAAGFPARTDFPVQRSGQPASEQSEVVQRATQGGLPDKVQSKMQNAFQTDFSNVTVTTNSSVAKNMDAAAFAQGNSVHFAPGQFKPNTQSGQALIGHELTHVVQQRQGRVKAETQYKGMGINANRGLEAEADRLGAKAARGERIQFSGNTGGGAATPQLKLSSSTPMQFGNTGGNKLNKSNAQEKITGKKPTDRAIYLQHKLRNIQSPNEAREVLSWFMMYGRADKFDPSLWAIYYRNSWEAALSGNPAIGPFPFADYPEARRESDAEEEKVAPEASAGHSQIVKEQLERINLAFLRDSGKVRALGAGMRSVGRAVSRVSSLPGKASAAISKGMKSGAKRGLSEAQSMGRDKYDTLGSDAEELSTSESGSEDMEERKVPEHSVHEDLLRGRGRPRGIAKEAGKRVASKGTDVVASIPEKLAHATIGGIASMVDSGAGFLSSAGSAVIAKGLKAVILAYVADLDELEEKYEMESHQQQLYNRGAIRELLNLCDVLARNRAFASTRTATMTAVGQADISVEEYNESTGSQVHADSASVTAKGKLSEKGKKNRHTRFMMRKAQKAKALFGKDSQTKTYIASTLISMRDNFPGQPESIIAIRIMNELFGTYQLTYEQLRDQL